VTRLVDVYERPHNAAILLYRLLAERRPFQSISHREMPTFAQHVAFIKSRPYKDWFVIQAERDVGACYVSKQNEIGVAILEGARGRGYASDALTILLRGRRGRLLANINPANEASIALFRKHGFGGPIQITLEKS
jgi:RimJ/RimL family protein N-acetyltransferase